MMEHLRGTEVQVVLSLKEGRGFDRIANPTNIVATLNGQTLETGFIEPDSKPSFMTDLVWKADKNTLRKMRCGQEPLKIECFETRENERKDKIGHVLLSLRSARIVLPRDGDVKVASNWHKLLNLRSDVRAQKPEILLALTIEEHEAYVRRVSQKEADSDKDRAQNNFPITQNKIATPYLVEEENLVQLGPVATCQSLFLLNVIAGTAKNLHLLNGESQDGIGNYSLWYRVMENDVRLKSFSSLPETWTLNEKMVIRIRSSPTVLRNYLRERPNFLVTVRYGDTEILGHSEIDLGPLMLPETGVSLRPAENGDTLMSHRCIMSKRRTPCNVGDSGASEAFIDLQLRLVHLGPSNLNELPIMGIQQTQKFDDSTRLRETFSGIDAHRNPCGDFARRIYNEHHESMNCKNSHINISNCCNPMDRIPMPRSINTATNSTNPRPQYSRSMEDPCHCYCLSVNVEGIELSSTVSSMRDIEFRFHHPKAEITSKGGPRISVSTEGKLRLQDIGWKLNFVSTVEKIRQLLVSFPPRISVTSTDGCGTGLAILDVDRLFKNRENVVDDCKREFRYEAALYDSEKKAIGTIDVAMSLEDRGGHHEKTLRDTNDLGPPIMDESLAYKIVEELELWKERQQEIFRLELRRKEERHLNRLSDEWQKRRANLEAKLACSVEQCKILANSLNKATDDLRTRRLQSLEKEARLIKANEDLQWRYEKNFKDLQDSSRKIQEELLSRVRRVNVLQEQRDLAESQIEPLRLENEKLRRLTSKQAEEIQACQKGTLTRDQTASLLQEVKGLEQKLSNIQKSKNFFKEQWGKAVREIHRMKMEHQQAIEVQIKNSKDELKNFKLEDILGADSSALTNDRMILSQIQREIDIIKPRSAYVDADQMTNRQIFVPPTEALYSQRDCRNTGKSDDNEDRLRKLIEERDSLLKTGSYSIDDGIVVKLNAEIRSLLVSN